MSSNAATALVQHALSTIHFIAETKNPELNLVTSNLDVIQRWGKIRKVVWYFFLEDYINQVDPYKSTKLFKKKLSIIISSQPYSTNSALAQLCKQACDVFNRLIVISNNELPAAKRYPEEDLHVHFADEERYGLRLEKIKVNGNGGAILKGPGKAISLEEYAILFRKQQDSSPFSPPLEPPKKPCASPQKQLSEAASAKSKLEGPAAALSQISEGSKKPSPVLEDPMGLDSLQIGGSSVITKQPASSPERSFSISPASSSSNGLSDSSPLPFPRDMQEGLSSPESLLRHLAPVHQREKAKDEALPHNPAEQARESSALPSFPSEEESAVSAPVLQSEDRSASLHSHCHQEGSHAPAFHISLRASDEKKR
jgi:hypothetical protein